MQKVIFTIFILTILCGCSAPSRFIYDSRISQDGGYFIETKDVNGFDLEVLYQSYSFYPNPETHLQEGKTFFASAAQAIATEHKREIEPIVKSMLMTNTSRNIISGFYTSYISGRVKYTTGTKP